MDGRHRQSVAALIFSLLCALTLPTSVVGADEASRAQRFRAEFGLRSDSAYVVSVAASGASADAYGVPLTRAEEAELKRRAALEPAIANLQFRLQSVLATFGGLYIDQAQGGIVDVATTDTDLSSARSMIESMAGDAIPVRVRTVTFSEAELQRLTAQLTAERSFQTKLGTWANEVWTDVRSNRVKVGIYPYSGALVAALGDQYGVAIEVYEAPPAQLSGCTSRDNCPGPPLRSGIRLYDAGCTSGFLGWYQVSGQPGTDVMLTAGHCANLVPAGHVYQNPNDSNIGPMIKEVYAQNSKADAGIIDITAAQRSNRIYLSPTGYRPVFSTQLRSEEVQGMQVCQSARISGYTCGTLYAWDFSITYTDGTTLILQRSATYAVASGDSGSGVFAGNEAFGIQSGINTAGRAIYSHITYVISTIGMLVNTSS